MKPHYMHREKIIDSLRKLPEQVSLEQVLDTIVLLDKIEHGLVQSDQKNTVSEDKLDDHLPEWLR